MKTNSIKQVAALSVSLMTAFMLACSGNNYTAFKEAPAQPVEQPPIAKKLERPSCEYDPVNYRVYGLLRSFYLSGGGGVNGGVDLVSGVLRSIFLGVEWTTFKMYTSLAVYNANEMDSPAVVNDDGVKKSNIKFSLGAAIGGINTGVNTSSKVILEDMVMSAFEKNLKNVDKVLSSRPRIWETSVFSIMSGNKVVIPVGTNSGLAVGDKLNIYKGDYEWTDASRPCNSSRTFKTPDGEPELIAQAEVLPASVNLSNTAILKISNLKDGAVIERGDVVRFKEFAPKKKGDKARAPYKYAVRVEEVSQMDIQLDDGQKIEMTPILKGLLEKAIDQKFTNYFIKRNATWSGGN